MALAVVVSEETPLRTEAPVGPWLRWTAVAAAVITAMVVVSGVLSPGIEHRTLVAAALILLLAVFVGARLAYPRLRVASGLALGLMALEAVTGALVALEHRAQWTGAVHLILGAVAFAATASTVGASFRGRIGPVGGGRDYLVLVKPRIMVLLLVTAAGGMFAAARGLPSPVVLAALLVGGALASGGASAINHVLDRDIDRLMARTGDRPVASGRVTPARALEFGLALSAFSFVLLAGLVNLLAAFLALAGNLFYILVYTAWLKRSTPHNIVIGGAAGAVPPLVGWAAATGRLSLGALFLFLIVFLWTPPHFWALALLMKRDYASAGVPMLPVVRGERATTAGIIRYALLLVAASILPFVWAHMGVAYLVPAAALGAGFLALAWRLRRRTTRARARDLFRYSLVYLAALFVALAVAPVFT
jgi:heme o synthase